MSDDRRGVRTNAPRIAIVMPVYNEAKSIEDFVWEILSHPGSSDTTLHIVDDMSDDGSSELLDLIAANNPRILVSHNTQNMGHGPSTIRALQAGLMSKADVIVSTDGDGHIETENLFELAQSAWERNRVVEGSRTSRDDPLFRRVVSLVTRLLVGARAGALPKDANTPHRAYPRKYLAGLLERLPQKGSIPNLLISAISRSSEGAVWEQPITVIGRNVGDPRGSTWGQRRSAVPSSRFVRFCIKAAVEWVRFDIGEQTPRTVRQQVHTIAVGRGSVGRYAVIGGSGVTLDFLIFWGLVTLGMAPTFATALGTLTGIVNNYWWNSALNFRTPISSRRGGRFIVVGLSGLVFSVALFQTLTSLGAGPIAAKWISIPLVVTAQFLANKFWTFR